MYLAKSDQGFSRRAIVKEGVLLRNVSAAPIYNHFAVLPPSSRIREPVPFLVDHSLFNGGVCDMYMIIVIR